MHRVRSEQDTSDPLSALSKVDASEAGHYRVRLKDELILLEHSFNGSDWRTLGMRLSEPAPVKPAKVLFRWRLARTR